MVASITLIGMMIAVTTIMTETLTNTTETMMTMTTTADATAEEDVAFAICLDSVANNERPRKFRGLYIKLLIVVIAIFWRSTIWASCIC